MGFSPRMHGCFNVEKSINIIGQANRKNNKASVMISTDAEKALHGIQHYLMIKNSQQTGN